MSKIVHYEEGEIPTYEVPEDRIKLWKKESLKVNWFNAIGATSLIIKGFCVIFLTEELHKILLMGEVVIIVLCSLSLFDFYMNYMKSREEVKASFDKVLKRPQGNNQSDSDDAHTLFQENN